MYESDEWYVQYDLDKDRAKMKLNAKDGQNQTMANTEDFWDIDSKTDENDSYQNKTEG